MKMREHVETLLRQGRKPKELVELGFSKRVIARVRRQLKEEKAAQMKKTSKAKSDAESLRESSAMSLQPITPMEQRLASLESAIDQLRGQLKTLETTRRALVAESSAEKGEVNCLCCQTAFQRDNVFSICCDCVADLEVGDVAELIDAYFGL